MNDLYLVKVKFYSNSIRKKPPCLKPEKGMRYSPHFVVKGDEEYLGVTFTDGDESVFDKEIYALAVSLYEGVGYHKLVNDAEFLIMEGPHTVGEGVVKEVYKDNFYESCDRFYISRCDTKKIISGRTINKKLLDF